MLAGLTVQYSTALDHQPIQSAESLCPALPQTLLYRPLAHWTGVLSTSPSQRSPLVAMLQDPSGDRYRDLPESISPPSLRNAFQALFAVLAPLRLLI
jgi:hypothetical protein